MAVAKVKDYDDSRSLASFTEERSQDLNISPSLNDESGKITKASSQQNNILGKFYEISALDSSGSGSITNKMNAFQGLDNEYRDDSLINYAMDMEQLKTLRAELSHCESMKSSVNNFKKCTGCDHESEILILKEEKKKLMLQLEHVKLHCEKLENFNESFLSKNVSLKKNIEHLLSEKNSLLMSMHEFESLDDYVKFLEAKVSTLDEVVQERNQLKLQVIKQKEIVEEFASLQQLLKTLTNQRDTLKIQLQELSIEYSQQKDSAKNVTIKLNRALDDLNEKSGICDQLLLLINEQCSLIHQLKKKLLALSENKEFYRKCFSARFKQLNLQKFESDCAKRLSSNLSKVFKQNLNRIKVTLALMEYFQRRSITPQKSVILTNVIRTALVNILNDSEEFAQKFLQVNFSNNENVSEAQSIRNRSFSDSDVSVQTMAQNIEKLSLCEDTFSVKCALLSFCAGNEALVESLFSVEQFEENNKDIEVNEINPNAVSQSRLHELETENTILKSKLVVKNELLFTLQRHVNPSNSLITETNQFLNEIRKNLIRFEGKMKNACTSRTLVIQNKNRSGVRELGKNDPESMFTEYTRKEPQDLTQLLESEFTEIKKMLVAFCEKSKILPFLEEENRSLLQKAVSSYNFLKQHYEVIKALQENEPRQNKILKVEKDLKTKLLQIEASDNQQYISDEQGKLKNWQKVNSPCEQYLPQEIENHHLGIFMKETSLNLIPQYIQTMTKSWKAKHQKSLVSKIAVENFSLSKNLISILKKLELIPVLHKAFFKNIFQLWDLFSNFEIKIEEKNLMSSSSTITVNLSTFDDGEIPHLLQQIVRRQSCTALKICFTNHSNASYLCTFAPICSDMFQEKSSLVTEKKGNNVLHKFKAEKKIVRVNESNGLQKIMRANTYQKNLETGRQFSILSKNNLTLICTKLSESVNLQEILKGDSNQNNMGTDSNKFSVLSVSDLDLNAVRVSESNSLKIITKRERNKRLAETNSSRYLWSSKINLEVSSMETSGYDSCKKISRKDSDKKSIEADSIQVSSPSKSNLDLNFTEMSESNNSPNSETVSSQFSVLNRLNLSSKKINESNGLEKVARRGVNQKIQEILPNQFSVSLSSDLNLKSLKMSESDDTQNLLRGDFNLKNINASNVRILSSLNVVENRKDSFAGSERKPETFKQIDNSSYGNTVLTNLNNISSIETAILRTPNLPEDYINLEGMVTGFALQVSALIERNRHILKNQNSEILWRRSRTNPKGLIQEVSKYSLISRECRKKYKVPENAIVDKLYEIFPHCTVHQYNVFLVRCAEEFRINPDDIFYWSVFRTVLSNPFTKFHRRLISFILAIVYAKLIAMKSNEDRNRMAEELWLTNAEMDFNFGCNEKCDSFEKFLSRFPPNYQKIVCFAPETMKNPFVGQLFFHINKGSISFAEDHSEMKEESLSNPKIMTGCLQVENLRPSKSCPNFQPFNRVSNVKFPQNLDGTNSFLPRELEIKFGRKMCLTETDGKSLTEELICEMDQSVSVNNTSVQRKRNDHNSTNGYDTFSLLNRAKYIKMSNKPSKKNWFISLNDLRLKNFQLQKQLCNFKAEFLSIMNLKRISDFEERVKKLSEFLREKNGNVDDVKNLYEKQFDELKNAFKMEKTESLGKIKNSYEEKIVKLRKALENEKAENVTEIRNLYENEFVKLKEAHESVKKENVDQIKEIYEKRIVNLRKDYEEKLIKLSRCQDKDVKSLSQIYVEKLKFADEIYKQSIESIEECNIRKLEDYLHFYETTAKEWETLIRKYSQEILNLQKHTSELEKKYNIELLHAKYKYETLFNLMCEAFDNEKVAIYGLLSESVNNFEDDFKENLKRIALKLDKDASISNRLFVKELERCRRKYEHNLKKQKISFKNLLEEAKKKLEKDVSQKSLSFSKVLICDCNAAVNFKDLPTLNVLQALEERQLEGDLCCTNVNN